MTHNHDNPNQLTAGCPGCIDRRDRALFADRLPEMTDQELSDIVAGREHMVGDWQTNAALNEISRRFDRAVRR